MATLQTTYKRYKPVANYKKGWRATKDVQKWDPVKKKMVSFWHSEAAKGRGRGKIKQFQQALKPVQLREEYRLAPIIPQIPDEVEVPVTTLRMEEQFSSPERESVPETPEVSVAEEQQAQLVEGGPSPEMVEESPPLSTPMSEGQSSVPQMPPDLKNIEVVE